MIDLQPKGFERNYANLLDDEPFSDKRLKRVMHGAMKRLNLSQFDGVHGDWQSFCEAIAYLKVFYSPNGVQSFFRETLITLSHMCIALPQGSDMRQALRMNDGIIDLWGNVQVPESIAYAALCKVKGAVYYDLYIAWKDFPELTEIFKICFKRFDNLTDMRYTDNDIIQMIYK